jgi:hypothetical protein
MQPATPVAPAQSITRFNATSIDVSAYRAGKGPHGAGTAVDFRLPRTSARAPEERVARGDLHDIAQVLESRLMPSSPAPLRRDVKSAHAEPGAWRCHVDVPTTHPAPRG